MSNLVVIAEEEFDLNNLNQYLKTPLPDFALEAIKKVYPNDNNSELKESPYVNIPEQPVLHGAGSCKLAMQFQHVKHRSVHDGPRIWSDRPEQLYGPEHLGECAEGDSIHSESKVCE